MSGDTYLIKICEFLFESSSGLSWSTTERWKCLWKNFIKFILNIQNSNNFRAIAKNIFLLKNILHESESIGWACVEQNLCAWKNQAKIIRYHLISLYLFYLSRTAEWLWNEPEYDFWAWVHFYHRLKLVPTRPTNVEPSFLISYIKLMFSKSFKNIRILFSAWETKKNHMESCKKMFDPAKFIFIIFDHFRKCSVIER